MRLKTIAVGNLIALGTVLGGPTMAEGVGRYTFNDANTEFINTGAIRATATAAGGVAEAKASQRVVAPVLAGSFEYTSRGNRYVNTGTIEATARAAGGLSSATASQDMVR